MKIVIFQEPQEVSNFCEKYDLKNFKVYAWTPRAIDELKKNKIKYLCPGDIYTKKYNINNRLKFIKTYKNFINRCDKLIINEFSNLDIKEICPFQNFSLGIRNFFTQYFFEIEIIKKILLNKPKLIIYYNYDQNFSPISIILGLYKKNKKKIKSIKPQWKFIGSQKKSDIIDLKFSNIENNNNLRKLKFISARIIKLIRIKKNVFPGHFFNFFSSNISENKKENILILQSDFKDIENSIELNEKKDKKILFWEQFFFKKNNTIKLKERFIQKLKKDKFLKIYCTNNKVCFLDLLIEDIKSIIFKDVISLIKNIYYFKKLNGYYNFKSILTCNTNALTEGISYFLEKTKSKTPIFIFQHGGTLGMSYGQPFQSNFTKTGGGNQNFIVYTKEIELFQKKTAKYFKVKTNYITGNSDHYKNIYKKNLNFITSNKKNKFKICLVVGQFAKVCENNFGIYREANMYNFIYNTLEKINNIDHLEVNIKCGYNFENYNFEIFNDFKNVNFISTKKNLNLLVKNQDIFILPSFSTTFSEISCSSKPIILYLDKSAHSLAPNVENKVKKRSFCSTNINHYYKNIDNLLDYKKCINIINNKKNINKEFIKNYCFYGKFNTKKKITDLTVKK